MFTFWLVMPLPHRVVHALMAVICLSICMSRAWPQSRMEGHSKLKIGRKEAHDTGDTWLHILKRSKIKVPKLINAEMENAPYLLKGKEGHSKLKIDRKEAHDTGDTWLHILERSKIKVPKLINAEMENAPYLLKGEINEFQTWYRDGVLWPASPTCTVTLKVKGIRSRYQSDACFPITGQQKVVEILKLAGRLSELRLINSKVMSDTSDT